MQRCSAKAARLRQRQRVQLRHAEPRHAESVPSALLSCGCTQEPARAQPAATSASAHLNTSTTRLPRALCTVPNHQPNGWERRPFHCTSTSSPTASPAEAAVLQEGTKGGCRSRPSLQAAERQSAAKQAAAAAGPPQSMELEWNNSSSAAAAQRRTRCQRPPMGCCQAAEGAAARRAPPPPPQQPCGPWAGSEPSTAAAASSRRGAVRRRWRAPATRWHRSC